MVELILSFWLLIVVISTLFNLITIVFIKQVLTKITDICDNDMRIHEDISKMYDEIIKEENKKHE